MSKSEVLTMTSYSLQEGGLLLVAHYGPHFKAGQAVFHHVTSEDLEVWGSEAYDRLAEIQRGLAQQVLSE